MSAKFPQTDVGPAKYILGLQIQRDRKNKTLVLHQQEYTQHLLQATGFTDNIVRPIDTPADPAIHLSTEMSPKTDEERIAMSTIPYRQTTGALLHLAINTRPDIAYAVSRVCKFNANPGIQHWKAVKRILRYLAGTMRLGIVLGGESLKLTTYSDADWAGEVDTRRSQSGFIAKLGGSSVAWSSHLQRCATLSSFAAEAVALVSSAQETIWIKQFLQEIGYPTDPTPIISIDNSNLIRTQMPDTYQTYWCTLLMVKRFSRSERIPSRILPHRRNDRWYFHQGPRNLTL